jgi:hypothetical protein
LSFRKTLTADINPTGRNYASGAEDGYVRLHHFDKEYLEMKDQVPEENENLSDDEPDSEEDDTSAAVPASQ